jgi:hypothetical protein
MKLATFALLCGLAAGLGASPLVMVSAGDPVLEDIRYVAREAGVGVLSWSPPFSRDEINNILADVEVGKLPLPAKEAYRRIQERLNPPMRFTEDFFSLAFQGTAEAGARFRSNAAIPWQQGDFQQPALLHLPFDFYFADFVLLTVEPSVQLDPAFNDDGGHFGTNVPRRAEHIDVFFPFRAFAAAGGAWWNIQIGRDQISFGSAHTGNLLLSDTPDYYDFARLSFFARHFKYSALVIQNPLFLSTKFFDVTQIPADGAVDDVYLQRHIYIHRLDFMLFNKLTIGLTEGMSVGDAPLEIRYLNPLMLLHNFIAGDDYESRFGTSYNEMNSSIFSLELNWTPVPSLSLYAQLVVDEFTTPWEVESDSDNRTPEGLGYLIGIDYSRMFGAWGFQIYGEAAFLDPYVYVDNSPWASFVWSRRMNRKSMEYRYRWTGYPEGRDVIVFAAGSRFAKDNRLAFSADLSFTIHGEHGLYWDWSRGDQSADETTPTGTPEKRLSASVGADWKPWPAFTLSAEIGGDMLLNARHTQDREFGAEIGLSVKYVF